MKRQKGTVLVLTLGVILVVVALSVIIISYLLSQSRLTKHQVDRTKARYAAQAGITYALEMLRTNQDGWVPTPGSSLKKKICPQQYNNPSDPCHVVDPDMPYNVTITIGGTGGVYGTTPVNATVDYTYSQ